MGQLFVDHRSGKIDVYHQVSLGASDTIRGKELYEQSAAKSSVQIQHLRGDNGVYISDAFQKDAKKRNIIMDFSGVGVCGKNGVAERAIQIVVNSARKMMLHQSLYWTAFFDMRLWTFTLSHTVYL